MRWKSIGVAVAIAALATGGPLAWARGWLAPVMQPLAGSVASLDGSEAPALSAVQQEHIARLAGENAELRQRLAEYSAIQGEGGVLPARVVVARGRIIARTRRTGRRYLELDVGRVDGVQKGMAVTQGWTLVGQVAGTDDGRCLVQELGDSESRVAAAVIDQHSVPPKRLAEGVLAGHGQRAQFSLDFVETAPDLVLDPGLSVVTAGADGRFPAGLVLGQIVTASHAGTEAWQVQVAPVSDTELAESLLVLRFAR